MRGGQPSTTQPMAGPWLSPKVVTRSKCPNVLNDMAIDLARVDRWVKSAPPVSTKPALTHLVKGVRSRGKTNSFIFAVAKSY